MSAHEAGRQLGYAAFPVAVAAAMVVAGGLGVQLKQARERPYSSEIR